jgi:hypothetical protein
MGSNPVIFVQKHRIIALARQFIADLCELGERLLRITRSLL